MANMLCPKCGKFQEKAENCSSCGIIVANYNIESSQQNVPVTQQVNEPVLQYAGFWRRFVAMLIDSFILTLIELGLVVLLVFSAKEISNQLGNWIDALWFILFLVYFAVMESSSKQATLGKMVLGLQVTDLEGNRTTFLRATGRNMAKILSCLTLMIGFLMAAFTEKKQGLHDMVANCLVIKRKESSIWKVILIAMLSAALLTGALGAYVYYIKYPQWKKATVEVLQDPGQLFEQPKGPLPEKTMSTDESAAPKSLTKEDYKKLLATSPPKVSVSGMSAVAGPTLMEVSTFFSDQFWIKVYMPTIPNFENKLATAEVVVNTVKNKENQNYYDSGNNFESEFFRQLSFSRKNNPAPHLEATRTVHIIPGINENNIVSVTGLIVFTLPINIASASFSADEIDQEKKAAGSLVSLKSIEGNNVKIHYIGVGKNFLKVFAYNAAGEELKYAGGSTLSDSKVRDTQLSAKFQGTPVKVKVLVAEEIVEQTIPFKIKK